MDSHEALKQAIAGRGPKEVASALGVSLSLVYKWTEPTNDSGARNPLDRVSDLMEVTGSETPLQYLCQRAGGVFVTNPDVTARADLDVIKETQRVLREFSDVLDAVSQAFQDGKVTESEGKEIRREWEELKVCGETLVRSCEAMTRVSTPSSSNKRATRSPSKSRTSK